MVSHGGEGYIGPFLSPALTAVETDIATYGRKVIALLQKHFDQPEDPVQHLTIPSSLVIRETTAKASRPI
mgnify:CR=1 FL=1